jgi:HEAT repeat protein
VTFRDEALKGVLSGVVPVSLDVDLDETTPARERFKEESGVPEMVLVDTDGVVLWRALGARPAEDLAKEIRGALEAGPPPDAKDAEAVRFRECVRLLAQGKDAEALAATERYLSTYGKRAEAVRLLRARARYGVDGTREPWLKERIPALIQVFDHPWPGDTLLGRLKGALGGEVDDAAAGAWVKEQNDAGDALTAIGEPAVDPLVEAMRNGSSRVAERCGWVLGRIRSQRARATLLAMAKDPALPAKTRIAVATAMGGYRDTRFLDPLAAWAGDRKQPRGVRYEAAEALRMTLYGRTDVDALKWANFFLDALEDPDVRVRGELLQGLLHLKAPYDLRRLAPFLQDERSAYADVSVSDLACWCVLLSTGKRVDGTEDTTPEVVRLVAGWLDRTWPDLVWDEAKRHYVEKEAGR